MCRPIAAVLPPDMPPDMPRAGRPIVAVMPPGISPDWLSDWALNRQLAILTSVILSIHLQCGSIIVLTITK